MSFYSRYYIQEMVLVFFTFGLIVAMYRLSLTGRMGWALASGACAGLMSATKETWIVPCGAIVISGVTVLLFQRRQQWATLPVTLLHLIAAGITGIMVSVVLFSSFFTHWQGVADAVLAYRTYFDRAGTIGPHIHPWYYYLELLAFWKVNQGPWWSEAPILICGIAGLLGVISKKPAIENSHSCFATFSASFALVMIAVYSLIPYKTPWLVVGAVHGLIVLAGFGIESILQWCSRPWLRRTVTLVLLGFVVHLGWQAYRANFLYYESPANPYVYAHTSNDVKVIARTVKEIVQHAPSGASTPVQVVVPESQYWPLPWYLRSLPNVGWWSTLDSTFVPTALILASREVETAVLERLYEKPPPGRRNLYVPLFERPLRLRPGVEIVGYVTLDLWNSLHTEK